jgi:hypothetical protein
LLYFRFAKKSKYLFLKTDGAGNLSFSSDLPTTSFTGATVETSIADSDLVLIYDDSATAVRKMTKANLVSGIGASAGQVIQVVSTTKTDTFSASVASAGESGTVTGLTATITPSSASNKIFIIIHGHFSASTDTATFTSLFRDATKICLGDTASNRGRRTSGSSGDSYSLNSTSITFLDSPSTTSAITYSLKLAQISPSTATVYVNRTPADDDASRFGRFTSTITVMEIKG